MRPATAIMSLLAVAASLWSCAVATARPLPKHLQPPSAEILSTMSLMGIPRDGPILVRIFKKESELEVWKKGRDGRFVLLRSFPICRWSGALGPKTRQGDRMAPEGFYAVGAGHMNPNSSYYLSFDVGYPNAYDRSHRATGSALMVHGTCSSAGCYAMTDAGIAQVYALAREAFSGGQRFFQLQAFPFRMTSENIVRYRQDPNVSFWSQLKEGSDRFEATGKEPAVGVSGGRYAFLPYDDEGDETSARNRLTDEFGRVAALLAQGRPAYGISYVDGGQHPSFRTVGIQDVSRPEALPVAGIETEIPGSSGRPLRMPSVPVQLARTYRPVTRATFEPLGVEAPVAVMVDTSDYAHEPVPGGPLRPMMAEALVKGPVLGGSFLPVGMGPPAPVPSTLVQAVTTSPSASAPVRPVLDRPAPAVSATSSTRRF